MVTPNLESPDSFVNNKEHLKVQPISNRLSLTWTESNGVRYQNPRSRRGVKRVGGTCSSGEPRIRRVLVFVFYPFTFVTHGEFHFRVSTVRRKRRV